MVSSAGCSIFTNTHLLFTNCTNANTKNCLCHLKSVECYIECRCKGDCVKCTWASELACSDNDLDQGESQNKCTIEQSSYEKM